MSNNLFSRSHKLYYDRSIITDQNVHNNRLDTIMFDKTIKQAYLVATPNSHNLQSTLTKKLQKYTDLIEEKIRIQQLTMTYIVLLVLSTTGIVSNYT